MRRRSLQPSLVYVGVGLLLCNLIIVLTSCTSILSSPSQGSGSSSTNITDSTPTLAPTPTSAVSPTAATVSPAAMLLVGCPPSLNLNWNSVVGTQANVNRVEKVICGTLEGSGMQAVVNVRSDSPDAKLDVYVYDNLTATPTRRFSVQGLLNGDAFISSVGTLVTAEVSPNDVIQGGQDLFKEYKWNGTTFGQVIFPALYPDMTRYQAEQDQNRVNAELAALPQGAPKTQIRDAWKLSPGGVAGHLAQSIFHWQHYTVTLPQGASKLAILPITVTNVAGGGFIATVHHLNEDPNNIFEVWQVTSSDGNSSISSPATYAQLRSPVSISGSAMASSSIIGQVVVYDDLFINVGTSDPIRSVVSGNIVQFTNTVKYQLNASGLEEGAIAFYATNQNNVAISNEVVMVKVFLSA